MSTATVRWPLSHKLGSASGRASAFAGPETSPSWYRISLTASTCSHGTSSRSATHNLTAFTEGLNLCACLFKSADHGRPAIASPAPAGPHAFRAEGCHKQPSSAKRNNSLATASSTAFGIDTTGARSFESRRPPGTDDGSLEMAFQMARPTSGPTSTGAPPNKTGICAPNSAQLQASHRLLANGASDRRCCSPRCSFVKHATDMHSCASVNASANMERWTVSAPTQALPASMPTISQTSGKSAFDAAMPCKTALIVCRSAFDTARDRHPSPTATPFWDARSKA
mmetsp:Transcript_52063/g.100647  ORF Transcript_52063/g.100647 Transcript_52063/m.100647 type:complete len:283 (+) Transcript_52063:793-1641(+)